MVGILTKTIIRSPVVRWILQVRIRERHLNDVVFVGEDFIHVKQVKEHGHLEHVATKADFDGRIRAARTLTLETADEDEDVLMRNGDHVDLYEDEATPRQCLVLTTDRNALLFLRLVPDVSGRLRFVHQMLPLPVFDRIIFQPGEHLAVDHHSRALAVAANEREVIIYSTRPAGDILLDRCPASSHRALQVDGVIQLMDFLIPSPEDKDHIILALIVVQQQRVNAIWIDWYLDADLSEAQIHPAQLLGTTEGVPNLLVPLRYASFFLVSGARVERWKDILCGSAAGSDVTLMETDTLNPGAAPRRPIWANWCRPKRTTVKNDEADHLYFVREDGVVCLVQAADDVLSSDAGKFECHVGTGFASIGDINLKDPDLLVASGDMSSGGVFSIGHWATPIRVADMNRSETMRMKLVEPVSNWSSLTDMVTSTLPGKTRRFRDTIFVTSGRQPYGTITELRQGLESRLLVYFEFDGLRSVTDLWALPLTALGHVLIMLSSPTGTRFLQVSPNTDMETAEEVDGASLALASDHSTLAAAFTNDGKIVQVTSNAICISPGTPPNFEDTAKFDCETHSTILAAAVEATQSLVVTAERKSDPSTTYCLAFRSITIDDVDEMDGTSIRLKAKHHLMMEPLCLSLLCQNSTITAFVATSDGHVHAYTLDQDGNLLSTDQRQISPLSLENNVCDSMVIIQDEQHNTMSDARWLLVCGLRNGELYNVTFELNDTFRFGEASTSNFGHSAVKLTQHPNSRTQAYAMNGLDTCLLSWNGQTASSLEIHNLWVSDKHQPELRQGAIAACTHMPLSAQLLSFSELANALVMVSGNDLWFTFLGWTSVVPRQIPVGGTPNRLIYSKQQRCLVSSSLYYDVQHFPSSIPSAKPEERRQIWPVIDFIPSGGSESCFSHDMQPGERVYALLEWSVKLSQDRIHSFILVGGSYLSRSKGKTKGRIKFLQPVNRNWTVVDVTESRTETFDHPVYALALIDDVTYVACVGKKVIVNRFSIAETKWQQICEPFELSSPGVYITFDDPFIRVSTAEDSHALLKLSERSGAADHTSSFAYVLVSRYQAPQAEALICHESFGADGEALLASKYGQVLYLHTPTPALMSSLRLEDRIYIPVPEASVSRPLTRIRNANVRPPWRAVKQIDGGTPTEFIACATDGSLFGIQCIDNPHVVARLSWLQMLCEWSKLISPHSYMSPPYTVNEQSVAHREGGKPIGLSQGSIQARNLISVRSNRDPAQDCHIDGDVLVRLMERGGEEILRKIIQDFAARQDRVGEWLRQHLQEELAAVDETMELLGNLLKDWL